MPISVQHQRRSDEARGIGQRRDVRRQFDAVAIAMQRGEQRDQAAG